MVDRNIHEWEAMTLRAYTRRTRGTAAALARSLGLSPCVISSWVRGRRKIPLQHCVTLERITNGELRVERLRPDVRWDGMRRRRRP